MVEVIHFQRRPERRGFSIERLFENIRNSLPTDIRCQVKISPCLSRGVFARIINVVVAWWHRGQVNHITGDVHFLAFGLPPLRTVLTVHDCGILHRKRGLKRLILRLVWFTWPINRCNYVVAVSQATLDDLVITAGVSGRKIRVIPDCVGDEFMPHVSEFNCSEPTILMIGTAPNKNLERAAESLLGCRCKVELVGTPTASQIAAFSRANVRLTVLGSLSKDEIVKAYVRCDLVLFPSIHEGFGLPILEAQAIGRPVVTSDRSSMIEVAGSGACFVDPVSCESIRHGVERVINDESYRNAIVERGSKNAARYKSSVIAAQYAALYREIASVNNDR